MDTVGRSRSRSGSRKRCIHHYLRGEDRNRETVQKSLELDSEIIDGTGTRAGGVTPLRLEKKATRNLGTKC